MVRSWKVFQSISQKHENQNIKILLIKKSKHGRSCYLSKMKLH